MLLVAVASAGTAISIASRCPSPEGTRVPPKAPRFHGGSFEEDVRFDQSPALATATRTLQAYLDARVQGSGADYYVGKCVRIGGWTGKWSLYSVKPGAPLCPGGKQLPGARINDYRVAAFARTGDDPMRWSDKTMHEHIGDHVHAAPGRYSYAVGIRNYIVGPGRPLVVVVGPGVNRYEKRLPAVVLGEFEEGPVETMHCPASPVNVTGGN